MIRTQTLPHCAVAAPSAPSEWILRFSHLLPPAAQVLDIACGSGRHAAFLAGLGHRVTGIDRDAQALARLPATVTAVHADMEHAPWPLAGQQFDAVVVTHYLWRALWPHILGCVRDGGVLASVASAWRPVDALEVRMDALQARMQPHQKKLDALGSQMDRMAPIETPQMRAAGRQLEQLAERQQSLAAKQSQLAGKMAKADDAGRDAISRDMDLISEQMDVLSRQMDRHSNVMDQQSEVMQRQSGKMETVAREMEAAAKPMEAIGRDMEALGDQIEREAGIADTRIRSLIDEAIARGLAQPVKRR